MWKQKKKYVMILAVTQWVSETDTWLVHADSMLGSQIYYTLELMCYYLWTTFTLGGDPSKKNVLSEKLINKIHFTASTWINMSY